VRARPSRSSAPPEALLAEARWIERNHPDVKMYDGESKSCGAYAVDTITIKPKGGPKTVLHFDNGDVVGRFVAGIPQYFGRAEQIPEELAAAGRVARKERLAASRRLSCEACVAPDSATSQQASAA
jgi:hypothetical protein